MTMDLSAAPSNCRNCGAEVTGPYCSQCGQSGSDFAQPFWRFLREGAEEILSLEGRLFRGVRDTIFRPGYLTKEYFLGRRVRHMHPVRLFLVASAIAYAAFVLFGSDRSGLLLGLADILVGDGADRETFVVVLIGLLLTPLAQRLVYWRTGRLYVEHLVLVLHTASFAMLLAPIEVLVFRVLPVAIGDGIEAVVAPVIVMYWVLALREVFEESLPVTLVRAGLVFALAVVLFIGSAALFEGVKFAVTTAVS